MADEISEAARGKIDTLLREISAGYDIDDDARDELRSHMEDKFLGYKRGEEPISDDDAFLLVREHFGKPEVISAMYQETIQGISLTLFVRWTSVALLAYISISLVEVELNNLVRFLFMTSWNAFDMPSAIPRDVVTFMMDIPLIFVFGFGALLIYVILRAWKLRELRGKTMWYQKMKIWQLIVFVFAFHILTLLIGHWPDTMRSEFVFFHSFPRNAYHPGLDFTRDLFGKMFMVVVLGHHAAVLWWYDRAPRRYYIISGMLALIIFLSTSWILRDLVYSAVGWGGSSIFKPGFTTQQLYLRFIDNSSQMMLVLMGYLIVLVYQDIRRRVIATIKPARAFHD